MTVLIRVGAIAAILSLCIINTDLLTENKQLKEHLDAECVCSSDYPAGQDPTHSAKDAAKAYRCVEQGNCKGAVVSPSVLGWEK